MNDPPPRGGIENPKDFQGGFVSEVRKQKIRNQNYWDEFVITAVPLKQKIMYLILDKYYL